MGTITTLKNAPVIIDLRTDFTDNGWAVINGKAVHSGCNQGLIKNTGIPTIAGEPITVKYLVEGRISGQVYAIAGGTSGDSITTNGAVEDTIIPVDDSGIYFYSDGDLTISLVKVFDRIVEGTTVAFNENANKWVTYLSYVPENMVKFIDSFFTFTGGTMWEHNVNELRNNFYGQQYSSKITFYCNLDPTEVKSFFSIREKSNKLWEVTDAYIEPREGKSQGQRSRLKKGRFKNMQGDWLADFLKDLNDPRYTTELEALFKGADLQGNVMEITIQNTDTVEVRLLSVDVEVSKQEYTY